MDKIAVVILNWNGCEMLRSFLPSVVRFSEADGAVVYVADNGSTDASVDIDVMREKIGMVFQQFNLFPNMTIKENIMLAPVKRKKMSKEDAEKTALAAQLIACIRLAGDTVEIRWAV